jgi:hypothetical protein
LQQQRGVVTVVVEIGEDGGRCGRRSEEGVAQMAGAVVVPQRSLPGKEVQPKAGVPQMPLFDFTPQPYNGPKADEILAKRKKFLNPALFLYYKKHVSSAQLPHLWSIQCLFFVKKSSTTTFPIRHCNVVWCSLPD